MKICPTCQNCFEDADDVCPDDQTSLAASRPGSRLIAQKYVLDQLIKCDDLEAEYAASRLKTDQPVAIKILPPSVAEEAEALKSFRREANAVAHLNTRVEHQYVVQTFDYGMLPDGAAYVVTELIAGQSLREHVEEAEPLSVVAAIRLARQVADGLGAAHRCGVVHGALHPSNIIVTRDYRNRPEVKIVNFGFAKLREHLPAGLQTPSSARSLSDDVTRYASPEQRAGQHLDARSDVYSLGVILFEMLAARLPRTTAADGEYDLAEELSSLRDSHADVSEPLAELVTAALRPKAASRLSSAAEFARQLRDIESGKGHDAPAPEHAPAEERLPPVATSGADATHDIAPHDIATRDIAADEKSTLPSVTPFPTIMSSVDSLQPERQPEVAAADAMLVGDIDVGEISVGEIDIDGSFREFPQPVTEDLLVGSDDSLTEYHGIAEEESEASQFAASPARATESDAGEEFFWHDLSPATSAPTTNNGHAVRIKPYVDAPRYERRPRPVFTYAVCAVAILLGCIGGGVLALRLVSPPASPPSTSLEASMNVHAARQVLSAFEPAPTATPSPAPENSPADVIDPAAETETDVLEVAKAEALKSPTPVKSTPTPPPLMVSPSVAGELNSDAGKTPDAAPEITSSSKTEPTPAPSASPSKDVAAEKAGGSAEDGVRCDLSVSRDTLEVNRRGGSGSVMATLNHSSGSAMGVSASTPDWSDIVVFSEPQVINGSTSLIRYSVKSVSEKAGTYRVQLKSRCGSKSLTVQVR